MGMFCYQCQEAAKGTGCTVAGVCGKSEDISNLQDLLLFSLKGLALVANESSIKNSVLQRYVFDGLFTTITNANFDKKSIVLKIKKNTVLRDQLKFELTGETLSKLSKYDQVNWEPVSEETMLEKAKTVGILSEANEDIRSLKELLTYGIKGMAAYAEHAANLGFEDPEIVKFAIKALVAVSRKDISGEELVSTILEAGKYGVNAMALLDKANTTKYGHPEITNVFTGVGTKPGILISGHDLKDIEELLEQTADSGVDVYTHSEMLPAHYYPAFKKYKHFIGNYGNAWWQQGSEFESFNGPILFTTNCIVPPVKDAIYKERIYTTGSAGLDGCVHIADRERGGKKDFSAIIRHAKKCLPPKEIEKGNILGGFAHNQVMQVADKVIDAVKSGAIKRFFVMAGCDGRMASRRYYADFASQLPKDAVILTAGCAKYRYNKLPLGSINGIPRVLDAGQCNDSYSLALIALKLKEVFQLKDINELPISYNISWYEQKAVIVLLALLHLGVKNIHLGPTLPAFLSPNVAKVLVDNFGIGGITSVDEDIKMFMSATLPA